MTQTSIILTDVDRQFWIDHWQTSSPVKANTPAWSVQKKRLRGGHSEGVDLVVLDNGRLQLSVLPTRGMGLWKGLCGDVTLGWNSPVKRPVHPAFVNVAERGGLGWLNGFNEWLCRCGLAWLGPPTVDKQKGDWPLTLHGRIANSPAHFVTVDLPDDQQDQLAITGVVDDCSLFGTALRLTSTISTQPGSTKFTIHDTVTNLADHPQEFCLLYHNNCGPNLLSAGAMFHAPAKVVAGRDQAALPGIDKWNSYTEPTPGYAEQVFYIELLEHVGHQTVVALVNADGDRALSLRFNREQLPYFALWKNMLPTKDGYVTGLEPATCLPNIKPFEREKGRVINLQPERSYEMEITYEIHLTKASVDELLSEIEAIQGHTKTKLARELLPDWSQV